MAIDIKTNEFIDFANEKLDNVKTVFELGSRDGEDSLLFKSAWPEADVYAFEAHPVEYKLHAEKLKDKVNWINTAIYDFDGDIEFYPKGIGSGIHSIRNRLISQTNPIKVPCCRVDTFCNQNNITSIDVMKIDVEGCTFEALQSCGELLKNIKIMHIETETVVYFDGQILHEDVINFLNDNKFKLIEMSEPDASCVRQYDSVWVNDKC